MSVADNLNRIIQAKSDIKEAIERKGVSVGNGTIDTYADKIDEITTGGGGTTKQVLPSSIKFTYSTFTELDMSQWDWSTIVDWTEMFESVKFTTLLNFPTNIQPILFKRTFYGCSNLTSIDLSNVDTSNVTDMSYMFAFCAKLTEIKMDGDVSNVTNVSNMFGGINTTGTFYYNPQYDYSKIIAQLPSTWTAVPME